MPSNRSVVVRGAIAGALAATAVVAFFLIADVVEGRPLETPTFLASVLFGEDEVERGPGLLAVYTALHYLVFIVVGTVVAWVLERARTPASLLLGVVIGFLLFDIVFYASVSLVGVDVVSVLGWPTFLAGNLLAGVVLISYLGRTGPSRAASWGDVLREYRTLREGLVAGLIGAVAVAVWFFILDAVLGRLFFTPAALGSALFEGVDQPDAVRVTAATVLGYTVVHVVAFLVTGLVFAALVVQAEEHPPLTLALVLLFVTFETLVIGLLAIVASWLLEVIPWWSVAVGNLIAAAAMGFYLWRRHPLLAGELAHAEDPDAVGKASTGTAAGP